MKTLRNILLFEESVRKKTKIKMKKIPRKILLVKQSKNQSNKAKSKKNKNQSQIRKLS